MSGRREIQLSQGIAHIAADYFARESSGTSLITVTRADMSPDLKRATIFLSILPRQSEGPALDFAQRRRSDFREYLKEHSRLKYLPVVDFELDSGEKNRQRIDQLTRL